MLRIVIVILTGMLMNGQYADAQDLKVLSGIDGFEFFEGSRPVLSYMVKGNDAHKPYERPHYIHPLYSLDGSILTEDVPEDHPHHHGIFTAWHQVVYNGRQIADAWVCDNIEWEVKSTSVEELEDQIVLNSSVEWKSGLKDTLSRETIMRESMELNIHKSGNGYRVIDFTFGLTPLVNNLAIGGSDDEKGYGGFNIRLKNPEDLIFYSDREVNPQNTAVQALPWMNFIVKDEKRGVVIMVHPDNPGEHDKWILRNGKSMQNPVFPGRKPVALPTEGITLRYRVLVYGDTFDTTSVRDLYKKYESE